MGIEPDLPLGEQLLPYFRRFIEHLASSSLSPKTIRNHVDNLWSLGGEIIRDLHYDKTLRKLPVERLLRQSVHELGGPAFTTAQMISSVPSTPPAASCTGSLNPDPQIPRTSLF
jgi:hypothetical protein